ncbi:MAG: inositol monophosphatase family protein [Candidatus Gastranaerophilales bacterium]|nr:inositol monophosphatase family protein [Candidatus Gastranaerophilales bacterium]
MDKLLKTAIKAAKEAGKIQLEYMHKKLDIQTKASEFDLVTQADKIAEAKIIDIISKKFPTHSFLAEESGQATKESEYLWVIDPIDGTVNYTHRFPQFCCSIGLYKDGKPYLGVVYDPCKKELFRAIKNQGAFLNDKKISTSNTDSLTRSLLATGFPALKDELLERNLNYFKQFLGKCQAIRRPGSAALDLCYVACGRLDGFWELGLSPWDTAAGALIVEEAGGQVTNLNTEDFDFNIKGIIATNTLIHAAIKEVINSYE